MAKYKVIPSDEAVQLRVPAWCYNEAGARERASRWTIEDRNARYFLLDPFDVEELHHWEADTAEWPWAVVEDLAPPLDSSSPRPGDQKVTRAAADGKARVELIPMHAILGLADAFNYGALKYQEGNWELAATDPTARKRYAAALIRHGLLIIAGEVLDPESGLPHWDMAAANCGIGRETDPETRGKRFKMKEPPK